jgi:hypothetical protein
MEPNNFEKDFRDKLNQREIEPGNKAWDRLDAMLSVAEEKKSEKKSKRKWLYIAASFVGFLLFGTFFFNRFKTVELSKDAPIVLEQKIDADTLDESGVIKEEVINSHIQKKIIEKHPAVAGIKNQNKHSVQLNNKREILITNHAREDNIVVVSSEKDDPKSVAANKYISAEKLLAEVNETKFETKVAEETIEKKRKPTRVNPYDLLLNAETELNQSFRESALDRFNKNFKTVKTAIVNRNYEE